MKNASLPIAGVVVTLLLLSGVRARAQRFAAPVPHAAQSAAALEAKIADLEVEREGLLVEWFPDSSTVRAADGKIGALRRQLARVRPLNREVSREARHKAVQAKIAELETVRKFLSRRYKANHLKAERDYVDNYLSVLRRKSPN